MTDRLKLRVWENTEKKYYYFDLSNTESLNDFAFWADEEIRCEMYETDTKEFCTGITDVDGNLIYEGDIVEVLCEIPNIFKIEWDNIGLMWCCRSEKFDMPLYELRESRVIGNIHKSGDK